MKYLGIYFLIINFIGLLSMYADKQRAKRKAYRIPEATLFTIAFLGGSIGSIVGMHTFRHKTKHWYFRFGLPAILVGQIALVIFLFMEFITR